MAIPQNTARMRRARDAYARRAWGAAYTALSALDRQRPLSPADIELFATVAYLVGRQGESADLWTRAHAAYVVMDDVPGAARCAVRLGIDLLNAGERVRGAGWVEKAKRLLDERQLECVECGWVLFPEGVRCIMAGDTAAAREIFERAATIARQFHDADLLVMARHGIGRALLRAGDVRLGLALLDEAMVAVEAGEVSPVFAGDIYCSVIEGSLEVFDARRAREWTRALAVWCDAQPDLVPYTGQCLVRRAEIMQRAGEWTEAIAMARRACEHFLRGGGPEQPAVAAAHYQRAELHRLCGELAEAEAAYRDASRHGRQAQPGLALMRLAQNQMDAAAAGIRVAVEQAGSPAARARLLPAYAEIMLACGDVDAARLAAGELTQLAESLDSSLLRAAAAQATGAAELSAGNARDALVWLRQASTSWDDVDAPYDGARVRVLMALAYRELGDHDAASLALDAARTVFDRLSAAPDVARVRALARRKSAGAGALTDREVQVLRLIATGQTNRAIGRALNISEKTVARHVSNIFTRLGLSSRAAATAFAYESDLV